MQNLNSKKFKNVEVTEGLKDIMYLDPEYALINVADALYYLSDANICHYSPYEKNKRFFNGLGFILMVLENILRNAYENFERELTK